MSRIVLTKENIPSFLKDIKDDSKKYQKELQKLKKKPRKRILLPEIETPDPAYKPRFYSENPKRSNNQRKEVEEKIANAGKRSKFLKKQSLFNNLFLNPQSRKHKLMTQTTSRASFALQSGQKIFSAAGSNNRLLSFKKKWMRKNKNPNYFKRGIIKGQKSLAPEKKNLLELLSIDPSAIKNQTFSTMKIVGLIPTKEELYTKKRNRVKFMHRKRKKGITRINDFLKRKVNKILKEKSNMDELEDIKVALNKERKLTDAMSHNYLNVKFLEGSKARELYEKKYVKYHKKHSKSEVPATFVSFRSKGNMSSALKSTRMGSKLKAVSSEFWKSADCSFEYIIEQDPEEDEEERRSESNVKSFLESWKNVSVGV